MLNIVNAAGLNAISHIMTERVRVAERETSKSYEGWSSDGSELRADRIDCVVSLACNVQMTDHRDVNQLMLYDDHWLSQGAPDSPPTYTV